MKRLFKNEKGMAISGILYSILILFLVLVFGILALLSSTRYTFEKVKKDVLDDLNATSSDFCYEFDYASGTIMNYYSELNGCGSKIVVPEEIDGVPVQSIAAGAFNNKGLELVDFSNASRLRYIKGGISDKEGAFANNKIATLIFGDDNYIEEIGNYAFYSNKLTNNLNLSGLSILNRIGINAFGKNTIKSVDLTDLILLKEIDDMAFYNNKLTTLDFSDSVKLERIGVGTFANNLITEVNTTGLSRLKTIDNYAFHGTNVIDDFDFTKLTSLEEIGRSAFSYNSLRTVDLSKSKVTTIKYRAFEKNSTLETVKFPTTLEKVGDWAFYDCSIKGTIDLSMITSNIGGKYVFDKNKISNVYYGGTTLPVGIFGRNSVVSLSSVNLPHVTTINMGAFYNNRTLTTVDFSDLAITKFDQGAFAQCGITSLKLKLDSSMPEISISTAAFEDNQIPGILDFSNLTKKLSIGNFTFKKNKLTKIILPKTYSLGEGPFVNNNLQGDEQFIKNGTKLVSYAGSGGEVTIPEGITELNTSSMSGAGITKINFASTITKIHSFALGNNPIEGTLDLSPMKQLSYIGDYMLGGEKVPLVQNDKNAKEKCITYDANNDSADKTKYLEDLTCNQVDTYTYNFNAYSYPVNSTITAIDFTGLTELETIKNYAFQKLTGNKELIGTNTLTSLKSVEYGAFDGNTSLEKGIDFSGSQGLIALGELCFRNANYKDVVDLSNTKITSIPSNFMNTSSGTKMAIKEVKLPSGVKTIGSSAFSNGGVKKINLPEALTTIKTYAFYDADFTEGLTIPSNVTTIDEYAFNNSNINSELVLPDKIKTIGRAAFYNCGIKGTLKIPNSLTTLGLNAFSNNNIEIIDLSDSVLETIPEGAFKGNEKANKIILNNNVKEIGQYAFYTLRSLKSVILPKSLAKIDNYGFGESGITNVTVEYNDVNKIDRFNSVWNQVGFGKAAMPAYGYSTYTLNMDETNVFDSHTPVTQVLITKTGYYKLEAYGAQGGSYSSSRQGGYGGYASGTFRLPSGTYLYVFVGTQPITNASTSTNKTYAGGFNGGGAGMRGDYTSYNVFTDALGGGGATDFRIGTSQSLGSRIVVAGGGSGASNKVSGCGAEEVSDLDESKQKRCEKAYAATISSAGTSGGFGYGGSTRGYSYYSILAPGGGGGWYGGGTGESPADYSSNLSNTYKQVYRTGGGSNYVYEESTAQYCDAAPIACQLNDNYYAVSGSVLKQGGGIKDPDTGDISGNRGDGYAKMTFIGTELP